ncbi:DeoR/GlpR family DNA-binding transcription regulator [Lacticaseibacillus porcinae]|uniref:DeoR/GlpR family DNA-binding transcription regulator n=1 Tax=Lacticaseibacillus porcinae TaxID=1123687 RepID=UPI000F77273E|nr:DeoR/GlpR family DNA-binding transcription regulator [Lacticaseibacillus porcinae]
MLKKSAGSTRQQQILDLLAQQGAVKTSVLATHFGVSRETIRRDLIDLNAQGRIKKSFGTILPTNDFAIPPVANRLNAHQVTKNAICSTAFNQFKERRVIYIDAGSTALTYARLYRTLSDYTIITNSIPVVQELATSQNRIISVGGVIDGMTLATTGDQAEHFLQKIKVDVAILGSSGFAGHVGPTSNSLEDEQIKKTVIANAQVSVVLADSSKATTAALIAYTNWQDIDYLITDNGIADADLNKLSPLTDVIAAPTN